MMLLKRRRLIQAQLQSMYRDMVYNVGGTECIPSRHGEIRDV